MNQPSLSIEELLALGYSQDLINPPVHFTNSILFPKSYCGKSMHPGFKTETAGRDRCTECLRLMRMRRFGRRGRK